MNEADDEVFFRQITGALAQSPAISTGAVLMKFERALDHAIDVSRSRDAPYPNQDVAEIMESLRQEWKQSQLELFALRFLGTSLHPPVDRLQ